jgi:hypothetical protein
MAARKAAATLARRTVPAGPIGSRRDVVLACAARHSGRRKRSRKASTREIPPSPAKGGARSLHRDPFACADADVRPLLDRRACEHRVGIEFLCAGRWRGRLRGRRREGEIARARHGKRNGALGAGRRASICGGERRHDEEQRLRAENGASPSLLTQPALRHRISLRRPDGANPPRARRRNAQRSARAGR